MIEFGAPCSYPLETCAWVDSDLQWMVRLRSQCVVYSVRLGDYSLQCESQGRTMRVSMSMSKEGRQYADLDQLDRPCAPVPLSRYGHSPSSSRLLIRRHYARK